MRKDDDHFVHCFSCTTIEPMAYAGLDAAARPSEPSVLRLICRSCGKVVARFKLAVPLELACSACEEGKPHAH